MSAPAEVVLTGDDPNGLATMLSGLLEANLARHPERAALLRPALIEIEATDAGVAVTVRIGRGRIEVRGGPAPKRPDIGIRGDGGDLLALSGAPLLLGLPDPFDRDGRIVLGRILRGRVRISGMFRRPVALSRFSRLLSVT